MSVEQARLHYSEVTEVTANSEKETTEEEKPVVKKVIRRKRIPVKEDKDKE